MMCLYESEDNLVVAFCSSYHVGPGESNSDSIAGCQAWQQVLLSAIRLFTC